LTRAPARPAPEPTFYGQASERLCFRTAAFAVFSTVFRQQLTRAAQRTANNFKDRIQMVNIFVGNLSFQTTQDELQGAFAAYGTVERVSIVTDRDSGQPRGFGFVEMSERSAAEAAISQLNGKEMNGRALNVNEARPKTQGGGGDRGGRGGSRW
jgi:RNA recognition motif-containing protein